VACFSVLCCIFPEGLCIAIKPSVIADTVTAASLTRHFHNVCQKYYVYRQIGGATEENRVDVAGRPVINSENFSICDGTCSRLQFL
jgi:hypothetical protein